MSAPDGGWGGSAPARPTAAGWYPDPDGTPRLVRWFDGANWSDVTTPSGPGVTLAGGPGVPPSPGRSGAAPAPSGRAVRDRTPVIVGAVVLGLVLVAVLAVVIGTSTAGGQSGAASPVAAAPASGTRFPPGTVRVVDTDAGISYPWLGDGWFEYDLSPQVETTSTAGQYLTTQEDTPAGMFIAQCTSGPLADGYGWAGAATLPATVAAVADSVRATYYPLPNERVLRRDEQVTVDGHAAHVYEFDLSWDVSGYDATGERAALLLVDVGRPAPALLYLSIPNTHAELYGVIDRVLADVDVL